ncbi:MAG TPA: sulfite exporter TauE/SafE family protein, partial [Thermoanaerobaculia bacterium]|nr:sulfite exporter TauE/SafE family protein [Thermoanaerobaculia bacterium]
VIGVDVHEAIPMSLAVVGATSLIGMMLHWRAGNVALRTGLLFGGAGILGALTGSRLTYLVGERLLLFLFGLLMLVVASVMLLRKGKEEAPHEAHPFQAILAGLGVGVLTGFLGVGGGFLIVPALMVFGNLEIRKAIGTSLAVIAINCAAGILGHLRQGGFDFALAALVTAPAIAGALVATRFAHRVPARHLRHLFALFVIAIGILLVVRNLP